MAGHRKLEAAAQGVALDASDDRLAEGFDASHHRLPAARERQRLYRACARELLDVGTCDEGFIARPCEDEDAHFRLVLGLGEGAVELGDGQTIERVEFLRAIDGDAADGTLLFDPQVAKGHGRDPPAGEGDCTALEETRSSFFGP